MNCENFFSSLNFQFIFRANFPSFQRRKSKDFASIMAIPIFEYENSNNADNNNNVIINQGGQVNHRPNLIPNVRNNNNQVNLVEDVGFIPQLINELLTLLNNYYTMRRGQLIDQVDDMVPLRVNEVIASGMNGWIGERSPENMSASSNGESGNRRRTRNRVGNMQDNQNPTGLPDIVSCHMGASLRINSPPSPVPAQDHWNHDQDELRTQPPPAQLVTSGNGGEREPPSEDDEYSSYGGLDLKLQVDCSYRGIGRDLRQIADNYELENDQRRRRRHPAERQTHPSSSLSFKFELTLKVAIPAVTLVALGLAYLRRSS